MSSGFSIFTIHKFCFGSKESRKLFEKYLSFTTEKKEFSILQLGISVSDFSNNTLDVFINTLY